MEKDRREWNNYVLSTKSKPLNKIYFTTIIDFAEEVIESDCFHRETGINTDTVTMKEKFEINREYLL